MHGEAVARLEVVALEVLEGPPRLVFGVAGQVHLAVLPDDRTVPLDKDRCVVAVAVRGQLGIAEVEPHAEASGLVEEGTGLRAGHLGLVEAVGLGQVVHPPPREEGGERQLREDHEVTTGSASRAE